MDLICYIYMTVENEKSNRSEGFWQIETGKILAIKVQEGIDACDLILAQGQYLQAGQMKITLFRALVNRKSGAAIRLAG